MNVLAVLLAFFFAAQEAPPASHARIARAALASVEKNFDGRFARAYTPDAFELLGPPRGVYLEGSGAVCRQPLHFRREIGVEPDRQPQSHPVSRVVHQD